MISSLVFHPCKKIRSMWRNFSIATAQHTQTFRKIAKFAPFSSRYNLLMLLGVFLSLNSNSCERLHACEFEEEFNMILILSPRKCNKKLCISDFLNYQNSYLFNFRLKTQIFLNNSSTSRTY